jgi:hypothetical protein
MHQLSDQGRLSTARVAGDQQSSLARRVPPGIDLLEQPMPTCEVLPLLVQEKLELQGLQLVVPATVNCLAAQGRLDPSQ